MLAKLSCLVIAVLASYSLPVLAQGAAQCLRPDVLSRNQRCMMNVCSQTVTLWHCFPDSDGPLGCAATDGGAFTVIAPGYCADMHVGYENALVSEPIRYSACLGANTVRHVVRGTSVTCSDPQEKSGTRGLPALPGRLPLPVYTHYHPLN